MSESSEEAIRVAIVIPAYNAERFLPDCLDSVLGQTHREWECHVMDDGSKDGTWEVLRRYTERDGRIHAYRQENRGNSASINALLDKVDAPFLMMMDADDCIQRQTLELCLGALRQTGADMVEFAIADAPETLRVADLPETVSAPPPRVLRDLTPFQTRSHASGQWINKCNKVYRTAALQGLRLDDQLIYEEDFWFSTQAHALCASKAILDVPLYYYRKNAGSLTHAIDFPRYVRSGIRRIWLSHAFFVEGGRLLPELRADYERDVTRDAFRMILQKNLKRNWRWGRCKPLFDLAAENLAGMVRVGAVKPALLPWRKRAALWCCTHRHYWLCRLMVLIASI